MITPVLHECTKGRFAMFKRCYLRVLLALVVCWTLTGGLAMAQTWEEILGSLVGDEPSNTEETEPAADDQDDTAEEPEVSAVDSAEAGFALREALLVAAQSAVQRASGEDGFRSDPEIRVPLPGELERGRETLLRFGLAQEVASLELNMNRAAEGASGEALPLLRDAVKDLVFDDPLATLGAGGSAATDTLSAGARVGLSTRLVPIVRRHVEREGVARSFDRLQAEGGSLVGQSGVDREDLTQHVNSNTLDGLLALVARGERAIRTDPAARTTPLLARVFGSASNAAVAGLEDEEVEDWPEQGDDRHRALKQALVLGARRAVGRASETDGFFGNPTIRIPLPESVEKVGESLRSLGMGQVVDEFELSLNRAAEEAAAEATPILVDAVKNVGFEDVLSILTGGDTAATDTLRAKTGERLAAVFKPIITKKMDEVGVTRSYERLMERGGPLVMLLGGGEEQDLPDYVTGKALDGLFALVAEEEAKIRKDPAARTTELLERIFGALGG